MNNNISKNTNSWRPAPTQVLNVPTKLAVILLSTFAAVTALWGILAKIPLRVNARGILVPSSGLFEVNSPGAGVVIFPFLADENTSNVERLGKQFRGKFTPPEWGKEAYDFQWRLVSGEVDINQTVHLAEKIVDAISEDPWDRFSLTGQSGSALTGSDGHVYVKERELIAIVDNAEYRTDLMSKVNRYKASKKASDLILDKKRHLLMLGREMEETKKDIYERYRPFVDIAIKKTELLERRSTYEMQLSSNSQLEQEIHKIQEENQLRGHELKTSLARYLQSAAVYAWEDARISSFRVPQWANVNTGTPLMQLSWDSEVAPNEIPIFLDQKNFSQISPGMEIIATPSGFSSSEIGGIRGIVTSLDPMPMSSAALAKRLGGQGTAALVSQNLNSIYMATARLEVDDIEDYKSLYSSLYQNPAIISQANKGNLRGGYKWNNNSNPPLPPREGLILNVQIVTRRISPVAMVIPILKESIGINTPQKLMDKQTES